MKVFLAIAVVMGVFIDLTHQSHQSHWNYDDESHWPGKCNTGARQSPINIISENAVIDKKKTVIKGPLMLRGYKAVDVTAINNGHTLKWSAVPGTPPPTVSGGPLYGNYTFLQFHLHWLSEHAIDGLKYPLEIHMVHIKSGVPQEEAVQRPDGLAVISVMCELKESGSHEALEEIMEQIPKLVNATIGEPNEATIIDITRLFSPDPQAYFTYEGSLTTPDCNEAVTWIIMEKPLEISSVQFKKLSKVDVGGIANYRTLQPSNRLVYRSASCASLASLSISLSIISSLWHCAGHLASAAQQGLCAISNIKRRLFGNQLSQCARRKTGVEN